MPNFENNVFVENKEKDDKSAQKQEVLPRETPRNKNERNKLENEQDVFLEEQKLAMFAKIMKGEEYYIAGGLAQEINKGNIDHRHEDIDIIIFKDQTERILDNFRKHGFEVKIKPKFTGHDIDVANFEIDTENDELSNGPEHEPWLYIGVFEYIRDEKTDSARRLDDDGDTDRVFPLNYFNREKQTIDYKGNDVTVADLRLVVSSKLISERPKDIKDVKELMPFLKEKYGESEIEELKNISKENTKTRVSSSFKHLLGKFEEAGIETKTENIIEYFYSELEKSIQKIENEDYAKVGREFLDKIKEFSLLSSDPEVVKKEFMDFIMDNSKAIIEYYENEIDKAFE